eukprot:SAG31_NODE_66_length_28567_cov_30.222698_16_plen_551_part_00
MHGGVWAALASLILVADTFQCQLVAAADSPLELRGCYNPVDSTACIQRGLDAAAATGRVLSIPRMPTSWVVTPLYIRRNGTHVHLDEGAVLEARRAAPGKSDFFAGFTDCLLRIMRFVGDRAPPMNSFNKSVAYPVLPLSNISLTGSEGATLRMWKQDYMDRTRYRFTEHRHAISAASVSDVLLSGLRIENSGGDGIDLSTGVRNVKIIGVVASNNYRQGMSVISAENMLVQDCLFQKTQGTPPESGVDFEPDYGGDRLHNITFINVSTFANHGSGFSIWPSNLRGNRLPITLSFLRCSNRQDRISGINIGSVENPGLLQFNQHLVSGCVGAGLYLNGKNHAEAKVVVRDSLVHNVSSLLVRDNVYVDGAGNPLPTPPILFGCMENTSRCGGVVFDNVTVNDTAAGHVPRSWLEVGWRGHPKAYSEHHQKIWNGKTWTSTMVGAGIEDFNGSVTVHTPVPCCPSSRSVLVRSDGNRGTRVCHSKTGEKVCCLTSGDSGCPLLSPKRPMPLCRHLVGTDRGGDCDAAHACSASYGRNSSSVMVEIRCNPRS